MEQISCYDVGFDNAVLHIQVKLAALPQEQEAAIATKRELPIEYLLISFHFKMELEIRLLEIKHFTGRLAVYFLCLEEERVLMSLFSLKSPT